ncbi:HIT domain-containing protein [Methanococcoides sp. SA1]|nr:HIT domain-containing protein [Methanococcoides sp. SA1]
MMALYEKWLKKNHVCPFCVLKKEEIIRKNKYAILTLARAPYCKDHLIITPVKHRLTLNSMGSAEKKGVEDLIYYGMRKLHMEYKNVTVLYREGNLEEVGKSINHLHYHLIPEMQIGALNDCWKKRRFFSEKIYLNKILKFRERFIKKK